MNNLTNTQSTEVVSQETIQNNLKGNHMTKPQEKITPVNNVSFNNTNHITYKRRIVRMSDINYINLTEKVGNRFISHIKNGGTLSFVVDIYKDVLDKKNNIIKSKFIQNVQGLKQLGFRNKTQKVYRYKIIDPKMSTVEKVQQRSVLFTKPGGKGKFEEQFDKIQGEMGLYNKKVDTVIDGFFGGGGYTLKNIEKLNFKNYIINDLDTYITKTMLGVKLDFQKVIDRFNEINDKYQSLIPDKLRNYKSKTSRRKDEVLKKLRLENPQIKQFYIDIVNKMNNINDIKTYDIYKFSSLYIFMISKTTNGLVKYDNSGNFKTTSFNHSYSPGLTKIKMIKHWSYLLNRYNVQISNNDIFTLLKTCKNIENNSLIYLDPPYMDVKYIYNTNNDNKFQMNLIEQTKNYRYRIYSNEDCETLTKLGIDKHFTNIQRFPRNNKFGSKTKTNGGFEFLGCSVNLTKQHKTKDMKSKNNRNIVNVMKEIMKNLLLQDTKTQTKREMISLNKNYSNPQIINNNHTNNRKVS